MPAQDANDFPHELANGLTVALTDAIGPCTVTELRRLTGGASRETWTVDVEDSTGRTQALILQRDRGGAEFGGPSFEAEDRLLRAAAAAGVPVPEIVADSQACRALGDARVTRRLTGESIGSKIVRGDEFAVARARLADQCGEALARIHAIQTSEAAGLADANPLEELRAGLDLLEITSPAFELAMRWLEDHPPTEAPMTVLHGDFRVGNLLVDKNGLVGVLDWELAHLGHPIEDLGWLCTRAWRFGGGLPVGGVGETADLLAAYRRAGGAAFTDEDLRWGIICGTLRWGLICVVQARRHLDGHVQSVELATIGRRMAENEHEILNLLGLPAVDPETPVPVVDHGRPTVDELLAAIRDHLRDQVAPKLAGSDAFGLRVAVNALDIVRREIEATSKAGVTLDESALAERIRRGETIDNVTLAQLRSAVQERARVTNPAWTRLAR